MPDVTVNNTPVTVVLESSETFTPASGTTIVANVQVRSKGAATVENGTKEAVRIASGGLSTVESEISVVLTDQTSVNEEEGQEVYISGFEV